MLLLISEWAFSSRNNTVEIAGDLIIMIDWIKILDSTHIKRNAEWCSAN